MLYRHLLRPLLFRLPAESAHHLAMAGLRVAEGLPLSVEACAGPSPRAIRR